MVGLESGPFENVKRPPYNRRVSERSVPNIGRRERFYPDEWEFGFPDNVDDLLEFYDEPETASRVRYAGPDAAEASDRGMSAFDSRTDFDDDRGYR